MARIRTIKPNFFTSEDIVVVSPLARLLFIATWMEADREGRFVWRPKTLKLRYLPGDDCDIEELTEELLQAGLVITYKVDGKTYAEIPTFTRHQVVNNREADSTIPVRVTDAMATRDARVDDATTTPLTGMEGKEKEQRFTRRVQDLQADEGFARFWAQYPVKKSKQEALRAWFKLKPSDDLQTTILAALALQKASPNWVQDAGKYIPHPASWLNGRRWEDEIAVDNLTGQATNALFQGAV